MLKPKNADRSSAEDEVLCLVNWQPDPSHTQDATELAMRKEGDIACQRPQPDNHPVCAFSYLRSCFAARASISEDVPVRSLKSDVGCSPPLVVPVVPLGRVSLNLNGTTEAGKFTRSPCPPHRADEHVTEVHSAKTSRELASVLLAALGQGKVGAPGVLARERPFRFAVANDVSAWEADRLVRHGTAPHRQFRISGMSRPYSSMYVLCSVNLSRMAIFTLAACEPSLGTRSITMSTR